MSHRVRRCLRLTTVVLVASAATFSAPAAAPQPPAPGPRLIVMLVVDQMRTDYLDRYSNGFSGGLRRLTQEGAWFRAGAYPYLNTVTCPGHSTLGTGALPYRHGMVLNAWYDRTTAQSVPCTEDTTVRQISYNGLPPSDRSESARRLRVPTLGDRVRDRARGRVVALSIKARSAIGLAGHKGEAVVWFDDRGGWTTSSAYASAPVPFVQEFVSRHPITSDYGRTWERMRDASSYQQTDDAEGERAPTGWTRTFPHRIGSRSGNPDAEFYGHWVRSPLSDEYLGRMAAASVDALSLGNGPGTDFLGISFSALDAVGHTFGPNSHEVQDVVARLDVTIGRLLDHLDAKVGVGKYVLGFSSDHGVAPIPEQVGGGRLASAEIRAAVNKVLQPLFGPGEYVAHHAYTDVYLAPGVMDYLKDRPLALTAVLDALRALPGISHVFVGAELSGGKSRSSADVARRAAAFSYYPERSGDLIIVPREHWLLATSPTTHGTLHAYDQNVPVILFGAGVQKGTYQSAATPADLAPTLAAVARVNFDRTDGRVLSEALAPRPYSK